MGGLPGEPRASRVLVLAPGVFHLEQTVAHGFCRELGLTVRRLEGLPEGEAEVKKGLQPLGLVGTFNIFLFVAESTEWGKLLVPHPIGCGW